jgi:hypothetical protein
MELEEEPYLRPLPNVLEDDFRGEYSPWAMRLTPDHTCRGDNSGRGQNSKECVAHFCRTNADKEGWDNKYSLHDRPDKPR